MSLKDYWAAQTDTKLARQQYETAGVRIELCQIKERRAEMISQHLPLADYVDRPLTREELIEVVNYAVCGRRVL